MKILLKNCETVFGGLKMIANTSSIVMNKYIKTIQIANANNVKFTPTGKLVIRHYINNGVPINWQLLQTESFDSDNVVIKALATTSSFGNGNKITLYGSGKNDADGSYIALIVEGDIDAYKAAVAETGIDESIDTYNTINFMG